MKVLPMLLAGRLLGRRTPGRRWRVFEGGLKPKPAPAGSQEHAQPVSGQAGLRGVLLWHRQPAVVHHHRYLHSQTDERTGAAEMIEKEQPRQGGGAAPMRTRQKGFTLLEMVVVVAVIGILLGIAIPSYQNYVIRSNRTEGQALLSDAAARQERYYSQNPGSATPGRGQAGHEFGQLAEQPVQPHHSDAHQHHLYPDRHADQLADPRQDLRQADPQSARRAAQPARPATTAPSATAGAETKEPLYKRGSFMPRFTKP